MTLIEKLLCLFAATTITLALCWVSVPRYEPPVAPVLHKAGW